jgi:hypothetical protein
MAQQETPGPLLVLVNTITLTYAQYVGKKQIVKARSPRPLTVDEIEQFRINPKSLIED